MAAKNNSFRRVTRGMAQAVCADWNRAIQIVGLTGLLFLLCIILLPSPLSEHRSIHALLMIAAGSFASGAIIGLILAAFGDEKQVFGSMAAAVNGVIGGFALSDLSKEDSAIRKCLMALARSAGLTGTGLIASVVVFFAALGFIAMYVNKQYLLNPLLGKEQEARQRAQSVLTVTQGLQVGLEKLEGRPQLDNDTLKGIREAVDATKGLLDDPEVLRSLPLDTLRACSKAWFLLGEMEKAEEILRKARTIAPDDPELIFNLANVLVRREKYGEAIAHLSFLENHPQARVLVYKLLGYACLFVPGKLDESEDASKKYLAIHPEDFWAKVNLACVYGQRGPQNEENRNDLFQILLQLIPYPAAMHRIAELTSGDLDFSGWMNNGMFLELIKPYIQPAAQTGKTQ